MGFLVKVSRTRVIAQGSQLLRRALEGGLEAGHQRGVGVLGHLGTVAADVHVGAAHAKELGHLRRFSLERVSHILEGQVLRRHLRLRVGLVGVAAESEEELVDGAMRLQLLHLLLVDVVRRLVPAAKRQPASADAIPRCVCRHLIGLREAQIDFHAASPLAHASFLTGLPALLLKQEAVLEEADEGSHARARPDAEDRPPRMRGDDELAGGPQKQGQHRGVGPLTTLHLPADALEPARRQAFPSEQPGERNVRPRKEGLSGRASLHIVLHHAEGQ
eukprot:scaffold1295_cov220-Pinguiococcus_pyrenoidosus.AAC.1